MKPRVLVCYQVTEKPVYPIIHYFLNEVATGRSYWEVYVEMWVVKFYM